MAVTGIGITMLQACKFGEERLPIALNNLEVTVEQEDLLKQIVGAIIPEGEVPGALSLEADKFVWVMADDCLLPNDQDRFMLGISGFRDYVSQLGETPFEDMQENERSLMLGKVMETEVTDIPEGSDGKPLFGPEHVKFFLGLTKQWTITGYMQSQYIMTEKMPYSLVPGSYSGCLTIDPNEPVNVNA